MITKRTVWAFLVLFSILVSSFVFYTYQILYAPNFQIAKAKTHFIIPLGAEFSSVRDTLYKYDIVQDVVSFSFLSKLLGYSDMIKPGIYEIATNMTNLELINLLRGGIQKSTYVRFSYGRKLEDIVEPITRNIAILPEDFLKATRQYCQESPDGFTDKTIIGMFIPNTYKVYYTISSERLLERLNDEYHVFWNKERVAKTKRLGLTPKEVSTLASIVQAESLKEKELPIIAGLYYNRLKRKMLLQADPTLVFALGNFNIKRVLNKHKKIDSPYNTYKYKGLPPGPINMPSIQSIDAVLNYKKHNYIFMCAKEDFSGFHNFSSNLREHKIHAKNYQRALSIEIKKRKN